MKTSIISGLIIFLFSITISNGQDEVINLNNPSFEGTPRAGVTAYRGISAPGWIDCGSAMFPGETPPDIHPGNFFRVTKPAQDGKTYIGLVARENETWESVCQSLSTPLQAGQCYGINLYLSRSDNYVNRESNNPLDVIKSQGKALVLRIYGGLRTCDKKQLLAESELIDHTDWRNYSFEFEATSNIYTITFEAFYKTPVLLPYNGNLLMDNISPITKVACPGEELAVNEPDPEPQPKPQPKPADTRPPSEPEDAKVAVVEPEKPITRKKEKTITTELNSDRITTGQTIQINKLYFQADTSSINNNSYAALDEVYDFLTENPNVRIEVGGHTNGIPEHEYCDKLSNARAQAVAEYLIRKGISPNRLEYKGYGKRKPIASNNTKEGRRRNQRVEIKILNVN